MTIHDGNFKSALLSDHIRLYDGALEQAHCQTLIERFENSPDKDMRRAEGGHSFAQLDVSEKWPDESKALIPIFLTQFNKYQLELNARYWPPSFSFEHIRMKRYLPNGQDQFPPHVDVMCQTAARRFLTAIVYLNEMAGGETVFPDIGISITPRAGTMLVFPPLWLFPHAGLPPQSRPKYILHTYLCYPA